MNRFAAVVVALALALTITTAASAQLPPVHSAGPIEAISADSFSSQVEVRALGNGRVIVNDPVARRLLMLDSRFATFAILFDSTTPAPLAYPRTTPRLVAVPGDSTWFGDPDARGFRVLGPGGNVVRRQSVADTRDFTALTGHNAGTRLIDRNHVVFAENIRPQATGVLTPVSGMNLIRIRLDSVGRDTIGRIVGGNGLVLRMPMPPTPTGMRPSAPPMQSPTLNVFDVGDDWGVLSTGAIAIVRAADYHVDWIGPDGAKRATPPVAWTRKTLSPDEKQSLVDSVRRFFRVQDSVRMARVVPPSDTRTVMVLGPTIVLPDVPDTLPAFSPLHGVADASGHFWVREGPTIIGYVSEGIYDAIDAAGRVVDRVQFPPRHTLVGFGPGGVAYLMAQREKTFRIVRVRLR